MGYDLLVWEGKRPNDDAAAARAYEDVFDTYFEVDEHLPPTDRIRAYVDALLRRWPDLTEDGSEGSPWKDGPLIGEASGPAIYFGMVFSMCGEASEFAARTAAEHGLLCYDPQLEELVSVGRAPRRGFWRR